MDTSLLVPGGPDRRKQVQDAKDMYQIILRNAERTNTAVPPFEFLELIGKGSFGRVYKCREQGSPTLVAVKILNIDEMDFTADPRERDETVKDFRKEVAILQQLKDSGARNVNLIHDAFDLHSQLWIVSDYCTGGSVRTLMRGNPTPGLEEHFVIPIARELAVAMKCVHDIGVIHRDIKCTNVYITEDGRIQLGDFGIVGIMDDGPASKRSTIIGTPWYMPREMHTEEMSVAGGYGKEVDIWAFGCTVYEMATGLAPNARVQQYMLGEVLEHQAPRLEGGDYSEGLRDFVACCLNSDPAARPSADQILRHPYIADTEWEYPTERLVGLIERYMMWEFKGGQRTSLFNPGGAAAPISIEETPEEVGDEIENWNFTTSDSFNQEFGRRYSHMMLGGDGTGTDHHFSGDAVGSGLARINTQNLTPLERIQKDHQERSANRGEMSLDRLFNPESAPYEFTTPVEMQPEPEPVSDLPLRNMSGSGAPRESTVMIDLDADMDFGATPNFNFDFDDIPTLKAKTRRGTNGSEDDDDYQYTNDDDGDTKRATRDWKFPSMSAKAVSATQPKRATMDWSFSTAQEVEVESPEASMNLPPPGDGGTVAPGFRPQLKHMATEPIGNFGDYLHPNQPTTGGPPPLSPGRDSISSMIDLDLGGLSDPADITRPSTAGSFADSINTEMTSGNPFDLEDDPRQNEQDRNRFSYHKQWQSEGGNNDPNRSSLRNMPMHARGNSMSSTESELDRTLTSTSNNPPVTAQVPAAASDVFDFDDGATSPDYYQPNTHYNPLQNSHVRQNLHVSVPHTAPLDHHNTNAWPSFGSDFTDPGSPVHSAAPRRGYPDYPSDADSRDVNGTGIPRSIPLARTRNGTGSSMSSRYTSSSNGPLARAPTNRVPFEFPTTMPPNPAILDEDAGEEDVTGELDRLLEELGIGLKRTRVALTRVVGLTADGEDEDEGDGDGEGGSEFGGSVGSVGSVGWRSEGEEGY